MCYRHHCDCSCDRHYHHSSHHYRDHHCDPEAPKFGAGFLMFLTIALLFVL